MSVFDEQYARYYDLLYADKDYPAEANYVASLIREHLPGATRLLELGCGTGKHAVLLADAGFQVHGVDRSEQMIQRAVDLARTRVTAGLRLSFSLGDVTNYTSTDRFDAVISLFHVVSYQTSNEALRDMFHVAASHLPEGGLFIFDVWYGPAVLSQLPEVRVKRLEDQNSAITRIAEPTTDFNRNTVQVNYSIFTTNKKTGVTTEFKESHLMRYLFQPELELLLEDAGLRLESATEWMTSLPASPSTWSVCFAARKQAVESSARP